MTTTTDWAPLSWEKADAHTEEYGEVQVACPVCPPRAGIWGPIPETIDVGGVDTQSGVSVGQCSKCGTEARLTASVSWRTGAPPPPPPKRVESYVPSIALADLLALEPLLVMPAKIRSLSNLTPTPEDDDAKG